ncbi:MAG TPA: hypothetical protein VGY76_10195 [Solirubrobacteraceae bacterium]|nr:hypothetical protein [Solirubrobacteraceae bacterium]
MTVGLAGTLALSLPAAGRAADYHVFVCAVPPGDIGERAAAPTDGVTYSAKEAGLFATSTCGEPNGSMHAEMRRGTTHEVGSFATVTFTAPRGLSIAGFNVWRYEATPLPIGKPGVTPMAVIYEPPPANATSNLTYSGVTSVEGPCALRLECEGRGTNAPWYSEQSKVSVSGLSGVSAIEWSAGCAKGGGPCPAEGEGRFASIEVYSLDAILDDPMPPTIEEVRGPIHAGGTFSGEQETSFTASDAGSGVYSAWIDVDGTPRQAGPTILNTNGGACQDLAATKDGLRSFEHPKPCLPRVSGQLTLNTASLKDGEHHATLYVDDAAGGQATSTWAFASHNAPLIQTAPTVTGTARVGSTLTATDGSFSAPPGAGALSGAAGQWRRCTAGECVPISGATSTTYTLVGEDLHHTIVYENTISDSDGETTSASLSTPEVQEPLASSGCSSAACSGGSATPSLGPITLNVPGNDALVAATGSAALGSTAPWKVSLSVAPIRVHLHTTIHLKGRVSTSPRPAGGKLIYLQARTSNVIRKHGRRVRMYGEWVTFQALRAHSNGTFFFAHLVRVGGPHTYQFRSVAPSEGQYRDSTGVSPSITVTET